MPDNEAASATQLRNIEQSTGRSLAEWSDLIFEAGPRKHGEIVAYLKSTHGMTHGNANALAHKAREIADGGPVPTDELLDAQYSGAKHALRPVYEKVVSVARGLGTDVDVAVQKTGVSLRRGKQFALIRVPSASRVELGLNLGTTEPAGRLQRSTGMCSHRVDLNAPSDVDAEVVGWLRDAYGRST